MKPFKKRIGMTLLTTVVIVFFSEKMFWYPQGYVLAELILFYAVIVYVCLWALDYFRIRGLSGQLLIGALFAFLVEGVLTPVMFEAGLFDPIMPAYFIGWHGLLSWIFGWYLVRKWLVEGRTFLLMSGCLTVGIVWGAWSLTYWLPEAAAEFVGDTRWSIAKFSLYAITFTTLLIIAHWLLGRGGWTTEFKPTRWEKGVILAMLLFFYATLSFLAAPLGWIKLGIPLIVMAIPLTRRRSHRPPSSDLLCLRGDVDPVRLPILLLMPAAATLVYGLGVYFQPQEDTLLLILETVSMGQTAFGLTLFLGALLAVSRSIKPAVLAPQGD